MNFLRLDNAPGIAVLVLCVAGAIGAETAGAFLAVLCRNSAPRAAFCSFENSAGFAVVLILVPPVGIRIRNAFPVYDERINYIAGRNVVLDIAARADGCQLLALLLKLAIAAIDSEVLWRIIRESFA